MTLDSGVLVAAVTTPCPALPAARSCVAVAQVDYLEHPGRGRTSRPPTSLQGEAVAWTSPDHAATVLPVTTSTRNAAGMSKSGDPRQSPPPLVGTEAPRSGFTGPEPLGKCVGENDQDGVLEKHGARGMRNATAAALIVYVVHN